jgi:hypothetical protein
MTDQRSPDPLPPLKLRRRRRLIPEVGLPSLRRRKRNGPTAGATASARVDTATPAPRSRTPLYWRVLRLRVVRPNGWQRALLVEGVVAVAVILVLGGKASIWTIPVLPIIVALLVKANDLVAMGVAGKNKPPQ